MAIYRLWVEPHSKRTDGLQLVISMWLWLFVELSTFSSTNLGQNARDWGYEEHGSRCWFYADSLDVTAVKTCLMYRYSNEWSIPRYSARSVVAVDSNAGSKSKFQMQRTERLYKAWGLSCRVLWSQLKIKSKWCREIRIVILHRVKTRDFQRMATLTRFHACSGQSYAINTYSE